MNRYAVLYLATLFVLVPLDFLFLGIVAKVVGNLIVKAVTAPFALLGALFGGGEELSFLEFEPGSAALDPADRSKLGSLAKALADRPGLKLDVTGRSRMSKPELVDSIQKANARDTRKARRQA